MDNDANQGLPTGNSAPELIDDEPPTLRIPNRTTQQLADDYFAHDADFRDDLRWSLDR